MVRGIKGEKHCTYVEGDGLVYSVTEINDGQRGITGRRVFGRRKRYYEYDDREKMTIESIHCEDL